MLLLQRVAPLARLRNTPQVFSRQHISPPQPLPISPQTKPSPKPKSNPKPTSSATKGSVESRSPSATVDETNPTSSTTKDSVKSPTPSATADETVRPLLSSVPVTVSRNYEPPNLNLKLPMLGGAALESFFGPRSKSRNFDKTSTSAFYVKSYPWLQDEVQDKRESYPIRTYRICIITTKKGIGKSSVIRHHVTRRIKAALREVFPVEAPLGRDYIFFATPAAITIPMPELVQHVHTALKAIKAADARRNRAGEMKRRWSQDGEAERRWGRGGEMERRWGQDKEAGQRWGRGGEGERRWDRNGETERH